MQDPVASSPTSTLSKTASRRVGDNTEATATVVSSPPLVPLNGVVLQRMEVSPGLMVLRVAPDNWEYGEFEPGQFAVLGLPNTATRCANSDLDEEPVG